MYRILLLAAVALAAARPASANPFVLPSDASVENYITINALTGEGPSLNGTTTYDGVARLMMDLNQNGVYGDFGDSSCSGSLLTGGFTILTAAHCVDDMEAQGYTTQITFLGSSTATFISSWVELYPGYSGAVTDPRDLAVLHLGQEVTGFSRYDIYRTFDEAGQTATLVGYGRGGNGTGTTNGSGTRRQANNYVDGYWVGHSSGFNSLAFDFDNPGFSPTVDPMACLFGPAFSQTGVANEGMIAPGDSGGAMFVTGLLAGVHSWGGSAGAGCGDAWNGTNSSWGEIAGDVRVAEFADWIDAYNYTSAVPEPGTLTLLGFGLAGAARAARRRFAFPRQPR